MSNSIPASESDAPEFSRLVSVARLSPQGVEEVLEANAVERAALAKRFDLVELRVLKATLEVQPGRMDTVTVTGKMKADYIQNCVVTLDPIKTHLDLDIAVTFVPALSPSQDEGEGDDGGDDEIETYENGKIDLGELVSQQLGIAINPYPRKPDAVLKTTEFGPVATKPQPFAHLHEVVKNKDKTDD